MVASSPKRGGAASASEETLDDWEQTALNRIGSALFAGGFGTNVSAIFTAIDSNADGSLSFDEFSSAIKSLRLEPSFSDAQLRRVFDAVDLNRSGSINYYEFVQCFRVTDTAGASGSDSSASGATAGAGAMASPAEGGNRTWQRSVIERVIATLFEYRLELVSAFKLFDVDGNGVITREEFRKGLQALTSLTGSPITDMQADELMRALDRDESGTIDYGEVSNPVSSLIHSAQSLCVWLTRSFAFDSLPFAVC